MTKVTQEELDRLRARVVEAEKDTARLDWLFNNPMEALDILGYHRIRELRFVRSEIDAAMEEQK